MLKFNLEWRLNKMKKINFIFPAFLTLVVTGCSSQPISSNTISSLTSTSISQNVSSSYVGNRKISLYAINDFHGAIKAQSRNAGIERVGTFLKEKGKDGNTLLINSGDMFQGSIESNYNYGNLLTDCMNTIEFDCFCLGNHEFDWGQEKIALNRNRKDSDTSYQTPFLGANIYHYSLEEDKVLNFASELSDKYVIRTLDNGLKVGIVGGIGYNQITSITSQYVDDLTFRDPAPIFKEISDELRTQKGCDVVILSVHAGQEDVLGTGLSSLSSISHKRYFDAVFCAHTHRSEKKMENGVPFIQAGAYGQYYSQVELTVDPSNNVTCDSYTNYYTSTIKVDKIDEKIARLVDESNQTTSKISNEVLGTLSGDMSKNGDPAIPNLVCQAMAEEAIKQGYNVQLSMCNNARYDLKAGQLIYGSLFEAVPFDNEIFIAKVKGEDLLKEMNYNFFYKVDENLDVQPDQTYTIAVLDYLATHRNATRDYDYFPSLEILGNLTKTSEGIEQSYRYREITADYIRSKGNINVSDYSMSNPHFSI